MPEFLYTVIIGILLVMIFVVIICIMDELTDKKKTDPYDIESAIQWTKIKEKYDKIYGDK